MRRRSLGLKRIPQAWLRRERRIADRSCSVEWVPPTKSGEPTEVPVGRDPLAARFDRDRREIRVGHEIALYARIEAQPPEEVPMTRTGFDPYAIRLVAQLLGERECIGGPAWALEYLGMRHHPNEAAQDKIGNSICLVAVDETLKPLPIGGMVRRILPVCVDEHVDIGEEQLRIPSGRAVRPYHPSPRPAERHRL